MFATHRQNILAFLFFLLLTAILARPVLRNPAAVLVGHDVDSYINPWADWWTAKALREADTSLWFTDYLFYPEGVDLTFHSFSHLNTAVSLTLGALFGRLPGYNLAILLNYVLAGFAMYQLAYYLTGSTGAALLAGIVFAFNSHNLYQSSHPVLVSIWVLPWATLFLMRALRENRLAPGLVAAVFLFLAALSGIHLLLLLSIWLLLFLAYAYVSSEWPRPQARILVAFALLSLVTILPLLTPQLREGLIEQNESFVMDPRDSISADLASYFAPPRSGRFVRHLYLGILPALLALLAVARRRAARLWLLLFLVAVVLALGPIPHINYTPIDVLLPWALPLAAVLRNMYRVNILVSLGLAMLVAYGWLVLRTRLAEKRPALGTVLFVVAALVTLLDYEALPFPYTPVAVSPFYTNFLRDVPDDVALAVVPTGRHEDKVHLFEQTFHRHPITGGVVSRSETYVSSLVRSNPLLRAGASAGQRPVPARTEVALRALAAFHIGYLVIDKTQWLDADQWRPAFLMAPVYEDDYVLVYETGLALQRSSPGAPRGTP